MNWRDEPRGPTATELRDRAEREARRDKFDAFVREQLDTDTKRLAALLSTEESTGGES